MPHLSSTTLTAHEQRLILRATAGNVRDHTIISLALGTGLRLGEIVGLDLGEVFGPGGVPRIRVRVRSEIATGDRAAEVFLPHQLGAKGGQSGSVDRDSPGPMAHRPTFSPDRCTSCRHPSRGLAGPRFVWGTA